MPGQDPHLRTFSIRRMRTEPDGAVDWQSAVDLVAVEEPLNIRLQSSAASVASLAVTMRTPGHDRELVAGFLLAEGIVKSPEQLIAIRALGVEAESSNDIIAELAPEVDVEAWRLGRASLLSSSCGLCGKERAEAIAKPAPLVNQDTYRVDARILLSLPQLLREQQAGFAQTGGLHAAALVATGEAARVITSFEDIGRHNALDKVLGWALLNGQLPLSNRVIFLSSRGSFELVQKTLAAQAPILACVGSPSSLAVETARQAGLTLIGFLREGRFNVYAGGWRINSN